MEGKWKVILQKMDVREVEVEAKIMLMVLERKGKSEVIQQKQPEKNK